MKETVIIRRCESYSDPDRIRTIVREGIEKLGVRPRGRVLVKPNVVFAHRRYATHSYTHPSVLEGIFGAVREADGVDSIALGERCAVTVPTRQAFADAGYPDMLRRCGVKPIYFDEAPKRTVHLARGTVHRSLKFAAPLLDADFKIWAPKLKNHVSSLMTCALKLNIGICDSKERLHHHDYLLEEKIADLLEVGNPDLIVVDAVIGGERNELVPNPVPIGALIMGTNAVAVDAVCARVLGLEPDQIRHLMIAHERGWGPVSLDEIDLDAEVSLEALQEKTRNLDRSYNDLRTMDLPVHLHIGNHPGGDEPCHTGCVNMLKAVFAILEANEPGCTKKMRPFSIVCGEYDGDVHGNGERVVVVGDCTKVAGEITGPVTHVKGCPVPVPYFMLYACHYGKAPSPYLDGHAAAAMSLSVPTSLLAKFANRHLGTGGGWS